MSAPGPCAETPVTLVNEFSIRLPPLAMLIEPELTIGCPVIQIVPPLALAEIVP